MRINSNATEAAEALQSGEAIDWQPGDGMRYELLLTSFVRASGTRYQVLVCTNLGWCVVLPTSKSVVHVWLGWLPDGSWMGLRPLLAAMGLANGEPEMTTRDRQSEHAAREDLGGFGRYGRSASGRRRFEQDARLGRSVRLHLEGQGVIVKDDEERGREFMSVDRLTGADGDDS